MRSLTAVALLLSLAVPTLAQTSAPSPGSSSPTGSSNPAVGGKGNTPADTTTGTVELVPASKLEKGANSFTEGQAKSRLEAAGVSNVADLKKDDDGIWRASGSRSGKPVKVGLDYKGNISAE